MSKNLPTSMTDLIDQVKEKFSGDPKIQTMFESCFKNTYETTIRPQWDGSTFVITGDIPAMWLRDSTAQVRPYLLLAEHDKHMADLIQGVIQKQVNYINHDPYANAFNETANGNCYNEDKTDMTPWIWERKYEIDSLCYPIQLAYLFWKSTGRTSHFNADFIKAVHQVIHTWQIEQYHFRKSSYQFIRENCPPQDTLANEGKGLPVNNTGMTWSGFRPSDDACQYGYLVPANMFAVVVLSQVATISDEVFHDANLKKRAIHLADQINQGIQTFGKVEHPLYGIIYAYETDGRGNYNLMDDANVPSLLSMPYLGYCDVMDPIYQNTRRFITSVNNPYYYEGKIANGIGSPHTPKGYVWPIALAMQGMTAKEGIEKDQILDLLKETDANTNFMHEGFHVDNPERFTRPWFSWANSMFSEFVLSRLGYFVKGSPLVK
ncbi:glycoside hydrolase family 125 protein [Virgibacillus salexigens]|uniref:Glycosyl hydrolase n=1 Tax=Virgibacillus kapii TaxID=1638645 RepID=A0ABQ2DAP6_9BACI|nr:glycoside hydrolase family 125 protein [Virgibacillus kapii]GGJ51950.1 glycosyl hydrolase [Virgibacillus kapii]